MAMTTYIAVITFNDNGPNAPIKIHTVANWIKKKTHLYDVYKRLTSDLNIHTDRRWGHGKRYSTQVGNKRKAEAEVMILRQDKVDFKTMSLIK